MHARIQTLILHNVPQIDETRMILLLVVSFFQYSTVWLKIEIEKLNG
jgi:hypothetical protein